MVFKVLTHFVLVSSLVTGLLAIRNLGSSKVQDFSLRKAPKVLKVKARGPSAVACAASADIPIEVNLQSSHGKPIYSAKSMKYSVNLAYQIRRQDGSYYVKNGRRTYLGEIGPHAELASAFVVKCPKNEGIYTLRIEVVQEGVAWQHDVAPSQYWSEVNLTVESADPIGTI